MLSSAIAGLANGGGAYAVLAVALILLYRTTGVLNFAIAGVGTYGTFVTSILYEHGWALVPAVLVGVAVGATISAAFGLVFVRFFFDAPERHRATVAIALLLGMIAATYRTFGEEPRFLPHVVSGNAGKVAGVVISSDGVVAVVVAGLVAGGLTFGLARSRVGRQLRGISQGPITCELLGIPVRSLSVGVWAVTGALAALALLLVSPGRSTQPSTLAFLVVPALAAALVAQFRQYGRAVAAGVVIGAVQGILSYYDDVRVFAQVIPFAMMLALLLWFERRERWDEAR